MPDFPRGKAFEGAFKKGRAAFLQGLPITACPYKDHRAGRHGNIVTYARGFIRAWQAGWEAGKNRNPAEAIA